MSRTKLLLLSLAAVLAVSAVASASALAAFPPRFYVAGQEVKGTETFPYTGTINVARMNSLIGGLKMMIECTENKVAGTNVLGSEGKASGEANFEKCVLYEMTKGGEESNKSEKCRIREPIAFKFASQLVFGPSGLPEEEFKPASGEIFVEIGILSQPGKSCLFAVTLQVKGTYFASGGAEGEIERKEHELVYTSTGGRITLGKEPAAFTNKITGLKLKKLEGEETSKKYRMFTPLTEGEV
jgi:hypothetical protein